MAHWATSFYDFQDELTGCYREPIHPHHHELAQKLAATYGRTSLLELGAGGGQFAVAAALQGFGVTALELRSLGTAHTRQLAAEQGAHVEAVTGDFYIAELGRRFALVCYWDGFGIGTDAEQRQLLTRLVGWLAPEGRALIEVYTPWYWAAHAGFLRRTPNYVQTYGFEARGCRMTDTYVVGGQAQTQSLRCYSPADLELLLAGTGLEVLDIQPGGQYDTRTLTWHPQVPLGECMSYTATLAASAGESREDATAP